MKGNLYKEKTILIGFSFSREESYGPFPDAHEGHYEGYRDRELPDGYTPYAQNCNCTDAINEYDNYVSDYDEVLCDDEPKRGFCQRLQLCFNDLGRLLYTVIDAKRY